MKRKIVAVIDNHFDIIWRRRFCSDFVKDGVNYVSYQKIQQYYIDENIRLAGIIPDYKFQIESPCVAEHYVERFPEKKAVLKRLYAEGVLNTSNTGYTIVDSNMIGPEVLIRNYLASDAFFEEYVGATSALINRSDAFGNSAQLPQILKAFGGKYLAEVHYSTVGDEDGWMGLDGSVIAVKKLPRVGSGGGTVKYAPCPSCKGFGCMACEGKGIDLSAAAQRWRKPHLRDRCTDDGIMRIGGEELMPCAKTAEDLAVLAEKAGADVTFGHWDYLLEHFSDLIGQVESGNFAGLKLHTFDYNPNNTGTYVTHIDIKQALNETEHLLLAGETLEALRMLNGEKPRSYQEIWKRFLICCFHDSAAATLVDPAYEEVKELFGEIRSFTEEAFGGNACIFNATSSVYTGLYERDGRVAYVKGLAPYSFAEVQFEEPVFDTKTEPVSIENEFFRIDADDKGLCRIVDKRYGTIAEVLGETRPFDLMLESDVGSAWDTLEPPARQKLLHDQTSFLRKEEGKAFVRLCYRTSFSSKDADVGCENVFTWSVTLLRGYDRVRFDLEGDWYTAGKRLRVCFPLRVTGRDIYGIPGGWLERKPYDPSYVWNGANGDWPAFRYAGVENAGKSVAVFHRGTPSYKILPEGDGKLLTVSVLRSPTLPTYLHEPRFYSMNDYDGLRDEGHHTFAFELAAYGTDFAHSKVVAEAEQFSRPPVGVRKKWEGSLPAVKESFAAVTHIKPAENGEGMIVRITEHAGRGGAVTLDLPAWVREVYLTDMPERKRKKLQGNTLTLRPFEIATLRFK